MPQRTRRRGGEQPFRRWRVATRPGHVLCLLNRDGCIQQWSVGPDSIPRAFIDIVASPNHSNSNNRKVLVVVGLVMSKREARNFAAAGVDVDAPRAKRRKDAPATSNTSPDSKQHIEAATANGAANEAAEIAVGDVEDKATVKEKGLQLWQTVKDAVDKECVIWPIPSPQTPVSSS